MLLRFLIYRRKSHFGTLTAAVFTAAKAPCLHDTRKEHRYVVGGTDVRVRVRVRVMVRVRF